MASSGTYNFGLSNGEGVLAAFERVRVRTPTLRAEHMQTMFSIMSMPQPVSSENSAIACAIVRSLVSPYFGNTVGADLVAFSVCVLEPDKHELIEPAYLSAATRPALLPPPPIAGMA